MKKCLIFGIAIFITGLISHNSLAQTIEITPSYGYQFGSKLNYGSNYIKIEDSEQFGITIGMEADDDLMIEASYFHYGTELSIRDVFYSPSEQKLSDLSVDWILVGGAKYFPAGNLRPFFGGALGAVIFSPSEENTSIISRPLENSTKFAFAFKGGVNIMISDMIGINLQGNLNFPVTWGGVYVGGGTGGVSGGVGVSSTTIIGGFTGGLVFRIN